MQKSKIQHIEDINNKQEDEISLKELILRLREWWRYLLSKWLTILIFGIVGGILGFTYAYFDKPIYTATTTFVLESGEGSSAGLGQYSGLASMVGIDLGGNGGGIFQGDNILELYKSRKMIEKALLSPIDESKKLLIDQYIDFNNLKKVWNNNLDLRTLNFSNFKNKTNNLDAKLFRARDSILGKIVEDINKNYLSVTKPDKKLSIIRVDVKSKNENFAKNFNDAIVKNVNDFYIQTKTKKSLDNIIILQHKTDSVRKVMNGAIYSAIAIVDATPNLNPTRQVQRLAPAQKSQFSAETNKAILSTLIQNLEMSKMALLKETPLIQVIDSPIFPLQTNRSNKLIMLLAASFLFSFLSLLFFIIKKVIIEIAN